MSWPTAIKHGGWLALVVVVVLDADPYIAIAPKVGHVVCCMLVVEGDKWLVYCVDQLARHFMVVN